MRVGDRVHIGFAVKGGAGFVGRLKKVDGNTAHVESETAGKYGKKTWKGHISKMSKVDEAIKNWKHAARDLTKMRSDRSNAGRVDEGGFMSVGHPVNVTNPRAKPKYIITAIGKGKEGKVSISRDGEPRGDFSKERIARVNRAAHELRKNVVKEDVEQIDELSKPLITKYVRNAVKSRAKDDATVSKRFRGLKMAAKKLTKEDAEQVVEAHKKEIRLFQDLVDSSKLANKHKNDLHVMAHIDLNRAKVKMKEYNDAHQKNWEARRKLTREDVERVDEAHTYHVYDGSGKRVAEYDDPDSNRAIRHANREEDRTGHVHHVHRTVRGSNVVNKSWSFADSHGKYVPHDDFKGAHLHEELESVDESKSVRNFLTQNYQGSGGDDDATWYSHDKKTGEHTIRRGYFYSGGKTSRDHADHVSKELNSLGVKHTVTGHGTVDKPFRGGASVKNSTHWWTKFKVHEETGVNEGRRQKTAKKLTREDVEQVDELSKSKLLSYITHASGDQGAHAHVSGAINGRVQAGIYPDDDEIKARAVANVKHGRRMGGVQLAAAKLAGHHDRGANGKLAPHVAYKNKIPLDRLDRGDGKGITKRPYWAKVPATEDVNEGTKKGADARKEKRFWNRQRTATQDAYYAGGGTVYYKKERKNPYPKGRRHDAFEYGKTTADPMGDHHGRNESVEQVDELSKTTLRDYAVKSVISRAKNIDSFDASQKKNFNTMSPSRLVRDYREKDGDWEERKARVARRKQNAEKASAIAAKNIKNRTVGLTLAGRKLAKEGVSESTRTLSQLRAKLKKHDRDEMWHNDQMDKKWYESERGERSAKDPELARELMAQSDRHARRAEMHGRAYDAADKMIKAGKYATEETIDEVSKRKMRRYIDGAVGSVGDLRLASGVAHGKQEHFDEKKWKKGTNRIIGVRRAAEKLAGSYGVRVKATDR